MCYGYSAVEERSDSAIKREMQRISVRVDHADR